jgi:hypothetical protein
MPQLKPCWAHVWETQAWVPQTPVCGCTPPPHTWFVAHVPQLNKLPQPSPCIPQL